MESPVPRTRASTLFKWYAAGDVEGRFRDSTADVPAARVSPATADLLQKEIAGWGALVVGRHLIPDRTPSTGGIRWT